MTLQEWRESLLPFLREWGICVDSQSTMCVAQCLIVRRGMCVGIQFVNHLLQWYILRKLPFLKCRNVCRSCGRKCRWYWTRRRRIDGILTISFVCSLKLCLRYFDPILTCCPTTFKVPVLHTRVKHSWNDVYRGQVAFS